MAGAGDRKKELQIGGNKGMLESREAGKLRGRKMEGGRKDCCQDSPYEVRILEGILWSLGCLHLRGKWERDLLKVTRLLLISRLETLMSTPGPASKPSRWRAAWWQEKMERLCFGKLA